MHILDILQELKAQTGKGSAGRKMDILMEHKENKLLKSFFFWALDPNTNYWQSKVTKKRTCKNNNDWFLIHMTFEEVIKSILDNLVSRKMTGNKAKDHLYYLYLCLRDERDQELLERIITGKPDVGFSVGTINKVWSDLIYDPAYMRCKGYSPKMVKDWDFENDWIISELKADGMFVNIIGGNKFETRSGEDISGVFLKLCQLQQFSLCMISSELGLFNPVMHGELVCWKDGDRIERSKSNGIINKVKLGGDFPKGVTVKISLWDSIPGDNFYGHIPYEEEYSSRFRILKEVIKKWYHSDIEIIEHRMVRSPMEAQQHFIECLQRGLEGTVLKHGTMTWKNHDSPNQLKLKNKFRFEMKVTGFAKGEGKYKSTFGSMLIESECGLLKSAISGMTDKVRKAIHEDWEGFIGAVIEVEANGLFVNDDGSYGLMHPRFKEHRIDRTEADTLDRIIQQELDSILGKEIEGEV